jgi:hypothetical protein
MKRWFSLFMALWILALPTFLGVKAIHYQIKINALSQYQLGQADQKDQICFSGALDKIKLKKETDSHKKDTSEKLSFFGFYFFEQFQAPKFAIKLSFELHQGYSIYSSGPIHHPIPELS